VREGRVRLNIALPSWAIVPLMIILGIAAVPVVMLASVVLWLWLLWKLCRWTRAARRVARGLLVHKVGRDREFLIEIN
jgi:hypothetical protein